MTSSIKKPFKTHRTLHLSAHHWRSTLPAVAACLPLLVACSQGHDLGSLRDPLTLDSQPTDLHDISQLLVSRVEDADVVIEGPDEQHITVVGDVDGDGRADWSVIRRDEPQPLRGYHRLVFGAPRPAAGTLSAPDAEALVLSQPRPRFATPKPAGDVNGDGYGDIFFPNGGVGSFFDRRKPDFAATLEETRAAWAALRGYLVYGSPDRTPGERKLEDVGSGFGLDSELSLAFDAALLGSSAGAPELLEAVQTVDFDPLGDIDHDGYADFALRTYASLRGGDVPDGSAVSISCAPEHPPVSDEITWSDAHASTEISVYYGQPERFGSAGAANEPAARLPDASVLRSIGDLDGDGHDDFLAWSDELEVGYLVPGTAERLSGEISLAARGVPVPNLTSFSRLQPLGDMDGDGYADVLVVTDSNTESDENGQPHQLYYLLYGAPERLSRPVEMSDADAVFAVPAMSGRIEPLGDWNGDGRADLLFTESVEGMNRRQEARLIPSPAARFSGMYRERAFEALPADESAIQGMPSSILPAGDIDGDGRADVRIRILSLNELPQIYVKYGAPLASDAPPIY